MTDRLLLVGSGDGMSLHYQRSGETMAQPKAGPIPFPTVFSAKDREELTWYLEEFIAAPYAVFAERGESVEAKLKAWGEGLFLAVFGDGPARDAYQQARERQAELLIQSSDPAFLSLPWELLQDPERPTPLALDLRGISRGIPTASSLIDVPGGAALRVLMVISRPKGLHDVDFQMVARPLHERLALVRGKVHLDVLRPPTFSALEKTLQAAKTDGAPYHALHFDGHGVYSEGAGAAGMFKADAGLGAGYLIFETANGDGDDRVPAGDFAQVMKRAGLPLVVLNACQSAALGGDGATTGATVATRLLEEGVRSVVAMSHSVYAVAAAEFMSAFYDALFQGQSVQEATTAGRLQMRRAPSRPSPKGDLPLQDWIVPVHYERSQLRFPSLAAQPKAGPDLSALLEEIRGGGGTPAGDPAHADDFAPAADLFVGRGSEFYTLEAAARTDRIVLIQGPGGTGKTELAKGFARWWRDTGGVGQPGWVFFHSFEPGLASFGLDSVLGEIARSIFGTEVLAQAAPEELRAAVVQALRAYPMLLVWDNFESVYSMVEEDSATPALDQEGREQIRAFLQEMGGAGGQSTVLITSRTAEDWLGALRRIELGNLPRKDAAEYASKVLTGYATGRTRSAENPKAYEGLMEWLDGHPLSMKLILPHLETRSAKDLLSGLTGQGPLPPEFRLEGRTNSLGASVQYSLTHIDAATCGLLPALSLFEGVADADVLMLMSAVEGCPAPFAGTERDGWAAALERAASLGLLTALGAGTYRLHPALPAYLAAEWRASAGPDFQAQQTATLLALVAAHAWFGQWLNSQIQGGNAQLAFGLIGLQSRTMGRMITAALAQDQHKPAQGILQPLNEYLKARGLIQEQRGWITRCLIATEAADGTAPAFDTEAGALWLFVMSTSASIALDAHNLAEADEVYNRIRLTLEGAEEADERDRRLAIVYHQLGMVAQRRGDLDQAEDWYKKSFEIEEALGNRPGMANSYGQLGIMAQQRGDVDQAEAWYKKSLEIKEALGNRPGMATTYGQLGLLAEQREDVAGAFAWTIRCILLFDAFGHPATGPAPRHLARLTKTHGEPMLRDAWQNVAGAELPDGLLGALKRIMENQNDT